MRSIIVKSIILISAFLSGIALAGTCNSGTVTNSYSISAVGLDSNFGELIAIAGVIKFSSGKLSINVSSSNEGDVTELAGTGTYSVTSSCVLAGNITWAETGQKSKIKVYLDTMDTSPAVNIAYGGSGIVSTAVTDDSFKIDLKKMIYKF